MTHELRKLAEAATPGPWEATGLVVMEVDDPGHNAGICEMLWGRNGKGARDAAYVAAANPKTVLALLDRIAELEGALKPFAEAAPYFEPEEQEGQVLDDDHMIADVITCGELRRAAELVKP